jgi:hypothetical protein
MYESRLQQHEKVATSTKEPIAFVMTSSFTIMPHEDLCLACSSSLLIKGDDNRFKTECCSRVICDRCLTRNPRLGRYNPCIACSGGANVLQSSGKTGLEVNGVAEDSMFVVGDDEDVEDRLELSEVDTPSLRDEDAGKERSVAIPSTKIGSEFAPLSVPTADDAQKRTQQHFIKRGDTLLGLAFKYGVDVC